MATTEQQGATEGIVRVSRRHSAARIMASWLLQPHEPSMFHHLPVFIFSATPMPRVGSSPRTHSTPMIYSTPKIHYALTSSGQLCLGVTFFKDPQPSSWNLVSSFPRAFVTECHTLGGLEQEKSIISRVWRLEVQLPPFLPLPPTPCLAPFPSSLLSPLFLLSISLPHLSICLSP